MHRSGMLKGDKRGTRQEARRTHKGHRAGDKRNIKHMKRRHSESFTEHRDDKENDHRHEDFMIWFPNEQRTNSSWWDHEDP
eukprot:16377519-Heterocapsa_arctica.AAC.1